MKTSRCAHGCVSKGHEGSLSALTPASRYTRDQVQDASETLWVPSNGSIRAVEMVTLPRALGGLFGEFSQKKDPDRAQRQRPKGRSIRNRDLLLTLGHLEWDFFSCGPSAGPARLEPLA